MWHVSNCRFHVGSTVGYDCDNLVCFNTFNVEEKIGKKRKKLNYYFGINLPVLEKVGKHAANVLARVMNAVQIDKAQRSTD